MLFIYYSFYLFKIFFLCVGIFVGDWLREVEFLYFIEFSLDCILVVEVFGFQKDLIVVLEEKIKLNFVMKLKLKLNRFIFNFLFIEVFFQL